MPSYVDLMYIPLEKHRMREFSNFNHHVDHRHTIGTRKQKPRILTKLSCGKAVLQSALLLHYNITEE